MWSRYDLILLVFGATANGLKIAIREAKRQNKDYQQFAIPTLGKVAAAFITAERVDWHKEVYTIVEPVIDDMVSSYTDKMDVDGRDAYLEDKRRERTLCGCIEALEQSFDPSAEATSSSRLSRALFHGRLLTSHSHA
jgi:proteasome component ECM29